MGGTEAMSHIDQNDALPLFDCLIHPFPASNAEFARYLPAPLDSRLPSFAAPFNRDVVSPAFPEAEASATGPGYPGSDAGDLSKALREAGVGTGVLTPLTRGLLPDMRKAAAIAAATNEWLAYTWLSEVGSAPRYFGSIRVSPRYPAAAVDEIERWAGDPRFVQVSVPLEAIAPYGQEQYVPIWEAAAHFGLPVMVVSDRARGIGNPVTPFGNPPYYAEAACQAPLSAALHLASLITEGIFERLPKLRFIFGDGGFDALSILHWRVTNDWRAGRRETPWVLRAPIDYFAGHVYFVLHTTDGPDTPEAMRTLIDITDARERLLFGSRWPYWDRATVAAVRASTTPDLWSPILADNAMALYADRIDGRGLAESAIAASAGSSGQGATQSRKNGAT
jgi:uncharacterized protein